MTRGGGGRQVNTLSHIYVDVEQCLRENLGTWNLGTVKGGGI